MDWTVLRVILNPSPPEFPNNCIYFGQKFLGEKDIGHIIHWDGSKDRVDVSKMTCMVQFVCFDNGKFSSVFGQDEIIGFLTFCVGDDERMAKMDGTRVKGLNWENILYLVPGGFIHISAEKNGRFDPIWGLTRFLAEGVQDLEDVVCFLGVCFATDDEVVGIEN